MLETWWRQARHQQRLKKYRELEAKAGSSDDFDYFVAWFGGEWPQSMLVTMPTWLLETRIYVDPAVDAATQTRIDQELARRRTSRAEGAARLSIAIAFGSMIVALGTWLVKSPF